MNSQVAEPRPEYRLWAFCVAVKLAIFAAAGRNYGWLSDELYFLDAADHLAAGYLDFPPLIAWVFAAVETLAGTDLLAYRAVALIVGIAITIGAIDLTRLLGGGKLAQWLTAAVVLLAPAFLSIQSILTMNVFDHFWWVFSFWLIARYVSSLEPRWMLALGAVYGLALLTKMSVPFWLVSLMIAAALFEPWLFRRRETWLAVIIMVLVSSPWLLWQVAAGFPFVDFVTAYGEGTPEAMVIEQPVFALVMTMNLPAALVWLPGLVFGLTRAKGGLRLLSVASAICLAGFLLLGMKFYFATPLFVVFTAAGALLWENWLRGKRMAAGVVVVSLMIGGAFAIPIGAPVLPPDAVQRLADFIRDAETERPATAPAPLGRYFPHFAEMQGWPGLVQTVSLQYKALTRDGASPTLIAAYYGQAGALNQLDNDEVLPRACSGHMSYSRWWDDCGPLDHVLSVGYEPDLLRSLYDDVAVMGRYWCTGCMSRENGLYIVRARGPRVPLQVVRERLERHYFF